MWQPYLEYMEFEDVVAKYSYFDGVHIHRGEEYLFVTPMLGNPYVPYIIHTHFSDGFPTQNAGAACVEGIFHKYVDNPPFILITTGKHGLNNFIKDGIFNNYTEAVNVIITINGNNAFVYEAYEVTPTELLECVSPWMTKVKTHHGIKNETLQCAYNIPGITVHPNYIVQQRSLGGNTFRYSDGAFADCLQEVSSIMDSCTTDFSSFRYSDLSGERTNKDVATIIHNNPCACCGKRRPTSYFYRIQGRLCAKCVNRIKALGSINIINYGMARISLHKQRANTRRANLGINNGTCPRCGVKGSMKWNYKEHHDDVGMCHNCGTAFFHKDWKRTFFLVGSSVYEYRDRKILSIAPLDGHPVVHSCYVCGSITTCADSTDIGDTSISICNTCSRLEHEQSE